MPELSSAGNELVTPGRRRRSHPARAIMVAEISLENKIVMVNGLRIYINGGTRETADRDCVFYSRRADGPYYLWRYEETLAQWRGARVHAPDFSPKQLSMSNWKTVPSALQRSLADHYQE